MGEFHSLNLLPAPRKPKATSHCFYSCFHLYAENCFFLDRMPSTNDLSLTILLPLPAALVAWSSTKKTRWFHCNCSRSTEVSQQLVCTALATGVLPELAPTEIYCIHACTVTMPATRIAAGVPLQLRTNVHLNKSNVDRARLFHKRFLPTSKRSVSSENSWGSELQSTPSPYSSLTWNIIETSSLFFQK